MQKSSKGGGQKGKHEPKLPAMAPDLVGRDCRHAQGITKGKEGRAGHFQGQSTYPDTVTVKATFSAHLSMLFVPTAIP